MADQQPEALAATCDSLVQQFTAFGADKKAVKEALTASAATIRALRAQVERLQAAGQVAAPAMVPYLSDQDLAWLQRFKETTEDDQSYDVPKDAMTRLAELGVVRSEGFGRYSITAFGTHVADPSDQFSQLPLKTHADHEADYKTAFNAKHGLTVGGSNAGGDK